MLFRDIQIDEILFLTECFYIWLGNIHGILFQLQTLQSEIFCINKPNNVLQQ